VIYSPGPGFFMRRHEKTPNAWTDSMMGKAKDTLAQHRKRLVQDRVQTATSRLTRYKKRVIGESPCTEFPQENATISFLTRPACGLVAAVQDASWDFVVFGGTRSL
jgi:hypothetical protein